MIGGSVGYAGRGGAPMWLVVSVACVDNLLFTEVTAVPGGVDGSVGTGGVGTENAGRPFLDGAGIVPGSFPLLVSDDGSAFTARLGDLDGDGAVDAAVAVIGGDASITGVVWGPLRGQRVPSDLDLPLDGGLPVIGEFTGGPPLDLALPTGWIVPGPWDGTLEPTGTWVPYDGDWRFRDANGDGILDDLEITADGSLHLRWGPPARFAGPPDVRMELCPTSGPREENAAPTPSVAGDLDGDGTPELSVPSYTQEDGAACGGFTVSLPESGTVHPFEGGPGVWTGLQTYARALDDWDGDGQPEVLDGAGWYGGFALLGSPVALTAQAVIGERSFALDPSVIRADVLPFDLDGDGQRDLLVHTEDYTLLVVRSDLEGISGAPTEVIGQRLIVEGWFAEGGVAFVTWRDGPELRAVPIGAAIEI